MLELIRTINTCLADYIVVVLLVAVGVYYTIKTRFVQVRCFAEGWRRVFGSFSFHGNGGKAMTSYQAFATSIAEQVGTGNIVGACGAILIGGPGAIFWMWVIAFFGMATIYSEAVLAQETRQVAEDGSVSGGPVYYIRRAFKGKAGKILAGFFSVAVMFALGFTGTMVQSNSIAETFNVAFHIPTWIVGVVLALSAGVVFAGGVKSIASVSEKIAPVMAGLYILGCLIIICARVRFLPETFWMIIKYAFVPNAILGGGIGMALKTAISQGVKRGLFSNEAGMGSTPHAHALAKVDKPHDQGVVAMIAVFTDTFVILTLTALAVISTLYAGNGILASGAADGVEKTHMAQLAFASVFGSRAGDIFIAVCLLFFSFSSILGWNLFARINFEYLFGKKYTHVFTAVSMVFIFLGAYFSNEYAWELADLCNQLMVLPNVLALLVLSQLVVNNSCPEKAKLRKE